MMKKRLFAFGLAGVMLMGMSMNVFAAEVNQDSGSGASSGEASITYEVPVTYTINIPTVLVYDSAVLDNNKLEFTSSNMLLEKDGSVNVEVAGGVNLELHVGGISDSASYPIVIKTSTGDSISDPVKALTFANKDNAKKSLKVVGNEAPSEAGIYSGTVTFNIKYDNGKTADQ